MRAYDRQTQALTARRQWLRRLALLGGAAAASPALRALDALPGVQPLHVVVVGAGLAGLCATYELERRGHRVTLLEADPQHLGGRVRTLRFAAGLYGEAGAMRIPAQHHITRHYVQSFGLQLRRFVSSNPQAYYFLRGQRARVADAQPLMQRYALLPAERGLAPDELWARAVGHTLDALGPEARADLTSDAPSSAAFRTLDAQSLQQLLESAGLSDEAIDLVAGTNGLESLARSAASEHVREELLQIWSQEFDEIVGGTDRLAHAFVQRLRQAPRCGCEVTRLTQRPDGRAAGATYRQHGAERHIEADYVLCTLPCPVLARIECAPALSAAKARTIRELGYESATKVLAVSQRRFWESEDGIYGGGTFTDLPIMALYYPSDNAADRSVQRAGRPGVLLASYSWGQAARRLAALPAGEREALALHHAARVHPQLRTPRMVLRTTSWSWDRHRLAGGAFAWFSPGQHSALHRHLLAPEGRLHFAGEHTSLAHSWMQGALQSALRAVQQILQAALAGTHAATDQ